MAVMASLEPDGRKWPKHRIDIVRFLAEAMRSIAFNEARKLKSGTQPDLVSETDLQNHDNDRAAGSVLESLAAPTPGSDDVLLERERQAKRQAKVALLRAQLAAENREISRIFELGLENLSKADIRQRLGMTDTAFWTADRRLTRRIEQLMEHWDEDDS